LFWCGYENRWQLHDKSCFKHRARCKREKTAEKIYANGIGSLLVTSNENFIGIITKTDLMVRILIKNLDAESTQVAEVMSQPLISIDASETLDSARKLLREKSIRHLAVTRDNKIVGIVSIKDL
jgi:signal-transduction protein with cAMP-binding, CBS, and nucleotidyltransferase domain